MRAHASGHLAGLPHCRLGQYREAAKNCYEILIPSCARPQAWAGHGQTHRVTVPVGHGLKREAPITSSNEGASQRPRECARIPVQPPREAREGERRATAALPGAKQRIEGRIREKRGFNQAIEKTLELQISLKEKRGRANYRKQMNSRVRHLV